MANDLLREDIWAQHSGNPMYRMALGAASFGNGNPEIAALHFRHAASTVEHPLVIHCLARCFAAMGNDSAAFKLLKAGMEKFPENLELRLEACTALFRMEETDAANELFKPVASAFKDEQKNCQGLAEELQSAIAGELMERGASGDLYDDKFVTDLWWDYNASFTQFNEYQEGSAFMSHLIRTEVGDAIPLTNATAVIDFGVMCGFPNYCLAEKFQSIGHFGIDRQALIKELNDKYYKKENIEFKAGDIFTFLEENQNELKGATLFHARTATVCYPAVVRELYKACKAYGINQIIGIEFGGLSKETLEFTDFRSKRSVAMRSNMFIHPYESLLEEAGFSVVSSRRKSKYGLFLDVGLGEATISTVARI